MILGAILAKPSQSLYDTLLIDIGVAEGIKTGDIVFALGNVPIGRIDVVYPNSSKVILFSSPGETTQAVISNKNIFLELVGRGGGNFEMVMPKDLTLQKGDQIVMPGLNSYLLATVETIISDPRDPLNKALLTSPVNIEEQKFVEVEE
jgi:cell shape-determining protein MreC